MYFLIYCIYCFFFFLREQKALSICCSILHTIDKKKKSFKKKQHFFLRNASMFLGLFALFLKSMNWKRILCVVFVLNA